MQEGAPEPFSADFTGPSPAQGKPWCNLPRLKEARAPRTIDPDPTDVRCSREIKTTHNGASSKP